MRVVAVDREEFFQSGAAFHEDDLRARRHHLADLPVAEPEHPLQPVGLARVELALGLADVDQRAQLLLRDGGVGLAAVAPPYVRDAAGPLKHHDDGPERQPDQLQRTGEQHRHAHRKPYRDGLRDDFAKYEQRHRTRHGGDDDARALVAYDVEDQRRDDRGERHVHQVVAQQNRRQKPTRVLEHA